MEAKLTWECADINIKEYQIFKNLSLIDTVPVGTHEYVDIEINQGENYTYEIIPIDTNMVKGDKHTQSIFACLKPQREYLTNWTFDCGLHNWTFDPTYPAELIDNQNGSVTVISQSKYGSIVPEDIPTDDKEWILQCNVAEIQGSAKMSIRIGGVWTNHPFNSIGNHLMRKTGVIDEIHIGANNDTNANLTLLDISLQAMETTELPCMTSAIAPYGICSASSEFSSDYAAWRGCNCENSSSNAWNTENVLNSNIPHDPDLNVDGHYWQWVYSETDQDTFPAMIPTEFTITPRAGLPGSWYTDNNPQGIVVFGIKPGTPPIFEEIFRKEDISDWSNGDSRTWTIDTDVNYIGVRIYITKTNKSESGGDYQTGFGNIRMTGEIGAEQVPGDITDFSASDFYQEKTVLNWTLATGNPLPKYDLYLGDGSEDDVKVADEIYPGYEYHNNPGIYSLYIKAYNTMMPEGKMSNVTQGEILEPRKLHISVQSTSEPEIETVPVATITYEDRGSGLWWIQSIDAVNEIKFSSNTNNQDITSVSLLYAENDMLTSIEGICNNLNITSLSCISEFDTHLVTNTINAFSNTNLTEIDLRNLNFNSLENCTETFMNSPLTEIKMPITPDLTNLTRTFSNIEATQLNLQFLKASAPSHWTETFKDSSNLSCINYINTTSAIDTTGIFDGTVIERPNAEQIQDLTDSDGAEYDWVYECYGQPLAEHPLWTRLDGDTQADDKLQWKFNGDEIWTVDNLEDSVINLGFDILRTKSESATITGVYQDRDYQNAWMMPFSKMIDKNNLVGARINGGKVEVVQRDSGTWTTKVAWDYTINLYESKDWIVEITNTDITVYINGDLIGTVSHNIQGQGYFGISSHRYEFPNQFVVKNYHVGIETQLIPCSEARRPGTGPGGGGDPTINPDGWTITESSHYDSVPEEYFGTMAFNCRTESGGDCWVASLDSEKPWWVQASNDLGTKYRPTKIEMKGRTDINDTHMNERRPNPLVLQGLSKGNWVEIQRWETTSWDSGEEKTFDVQDNLGGFSDFRFVWENNGGALEAGAEMGWIKLYGYEFPEITEDYVVYRGQIVSNENERVIYTPTP